MNKLSKRTLFRKLTASFVLFFMFEALASDINQPLPSLSWQKTQLEGLIIGKVEKTLDRILKKNEYTIDVSLEVSEPEGPEWNKSDDPMKKGGENSRSTASAPEGEKGSKDDPAAKEGEEAGKDENKEDKDNKDKKRDPASLSPNKIRFDDQDLPETPEDFVVFNKFGLEAPLVDDFNDLQPDGKIVLAMSNGGGAGRDPASLELENNLEEVEEERDTLKSELEIAKAQAEKAKQAAKNMRSPTSTVEKIWKYNQAIDIYKNLAKVDILVRISQGLSEEQRQTAERFVKAINFNLGEVKPKVKVEFVKLGKDFEKKNNPWGDILKVISVFGQYATLFGIVIGVILFGIMAKGLIAKYHELNSGTSSQGAFTMENGASDEDDKSDSGSGLGSMPGSGLDGEANLNINGVERFKNFIGHSKEDAILLVKKWLKEKDKNQMAALKALVQQMDNDALKPILMTLSESEKNEWRELLEEGLTSEELARANSFIGNQIIQNIMVPSFIKDPNVYSKIVQVKPNQFKNIVEKDFNTACMLLSLMSPDFVNSVFAYFDEELQQKLIQGSLSVTPDHFEKGQARIAKALSFIDDNPKVRPFLDGLAKMIPSAGRDVERLLYTNFIKEAPESRADFILREYFPGFLLNELPEELIKAVFNAYPMSKRVKLLKSLPEDTADYYLDIFAPAGTKANDLIQIEFETIERDDTLIKEIEANRDEYWRDFVKFLRTRLKAEKQFASQVDEVVAIWREDTTTESRAA
ncbi:MAG: hypothetical protein CME63_10200 [Halobacteriovoraceae bacterium]|nr:hypothetical protein [Halobacteriovoraceae bacterium]|tara:strand:+ start:34191 stop:36443 length:2253 start_codon:yes stop_codon:yes gene_type:complete